jgi:lipopolysaccharide transport system ATP-binding protein
MRFSADVYIFDEVLAVVDDAFMQRCLREVRALVKAGRTVLFVSHNIHTVKSVSDRGLWIERGRVQAVGPIDEVAELYTAASADDIARQATMHREYSAKVVR